VPIAINQSPGESSRSGGAGGIVSSGARTQLKGMDRLAETRETAANKVLSTAFPGNLSAFLKRKWNNAHSAKEPMEQELFKSQRQRNAEYEPGLLGIVKEVGGSEDYMPITADKCRALLAWIVDVLLTTGERPWSLRHTPVPDLPQEAIQAIQEEVVNLVMTGQLPEEAAFEASALYADYLKDQSVREAAERAKKMETQIEDNLVESNFDEEFRAFLDDFVTFPTAILAGPFIRPKKVTKWEGGKLSIQTDLRLMFERVSPFDIYPGPTMRHLNEGYFFHKETADRQYLYELRPLPGFNTTMIDYVLAQPNTGSLSTGVDEQERNDLEDRPQQQIFENEDSQVTIYKYWGQARGRDLVEWGRNDSEIADPEKMYEIEAWMVNDIIIRAVLNPHPLGIRPYYSSSYEKKPGSFWGFSVPDRMRNIQDIINAACRSLVNNMSITAGPQIIVNNDAIPSGLDIMHHQAFRVWPYQGGYASNPSGKPPIEFYQPQSTVEKLMGVFQYFRELADDASGIPRYVHGNSEIGGAGSTASGLSMLLGASARGVKLAIYNIDIDIIHKIVDALFTFNMLYNPDSSIKGDVNIVSAGALALLNRDQLQQGRQEFSDRTNNEMDSQIIDLEGRAELLRQIAGPLELNPGVIPTREELAERLIRMAEAARAEEIAGDQQTTKKEGAA